MYIRVYLQQHDLFKISMLSLQVWNFITLIRDGMFKVLYCQTPITDASVSLKKSQHRALAKKNKHP